MELFEEQQHAVAMAIRMLGKNPGKVVKECQDRPVMITKYEQPVACVVSIEYWNSLMRQLNGFRQEQQLREIEAGSGKWPGV